MLFTKRREEKKTALLINKHTHVVTLTNTTEQNSREVEKKNVNKNLSQQPPKKEPRREKQQNAK